MHFSASCTLSTVGCRLWSNNLDTIGFFPAVNDSGIKHLIPDMTPLLLTEEDGSAS